MKTKYALAAKLATNMVVEILAARHKWTVNETLSRFTKTRIYELLTDSATGLWTDNPADIADMADFEFSGQAIPPEMYFR